MFSSFPGGIIMRSIVHRITIGFILILITALLPAAAAAGWMGGITFNHPSPSYLPSLEYVEVTIDCYVTQPGGVQILVKPYTGGFPTDSGTYHGSTLVPNGENTVTREFTVGRSAGEQTVDHVLIEMRTADFNTVLMEFFVRVRYEFGPYGIYNIQLDQVDHSVLANGTYLNMDFDYETSGPDNVLVFARPYFEGSPATSYQASGAAGGTPSGHGSQAFTFASLAKDVDQIRFYMTDIAQTETLFECFLPVDYSWRAVGITNLSFDVESPAQVYVDDRVTASFDYDNQSGEEIRFWVQPYQDGHFAPNNLYQGSASTYPVGAGSESRWFGATGPSHINQAHLSVTNSDLSTIYIDKLIPVEYQVSEHMVYNIETIPEPPALMDFGTLLDITFYYKSTDPGPIYIYAEPYFQGSVVGAHGSTGSPAYSTPFGTGGLDILIESYSPILEADQLRFSIWHSSTLLDESFVDGPFLWGDAGTITPVPGAKPLAAVLLDQNHPNPFNPVTSIPVELSGTRHVRLAVYDLRGRLVSVLADEVMGTGRHEVTFDGTGLASGAYYYRLEGAGQVQTRSMMLVK